MVTDRNTQEHIAEQVMRLQGTRVFICGDLVLDTYIEGQVSRISPEAPVPVVLEKSRRDVLGGAGNVAANVLSLGAKAVLCGRLGDDAPAARFVSLCTAQGIDLRALVHPELPTICKTRVLGGTQQMLRIDTEVICDLAAHEELAAEQQFQAFLKIPGPKALVLSDYGKGMLTPSLLGTLIALARKHNVPVVTDPKSSDLARYAGSSVIKPNLKEGREIVLRTHPHRDVADFDAEVRLICQQVLEASGAEAVVLSLSEQGVAILEQPQKTSDSGDNSRARLVRLASVALQVADVSGAGDTMIACLAMALAAGLPCARAAHIGNVAAGVVCGKPGTATLSTSELMQAFQAATEATQPEKIMGLAQAAALALAHRSVGRRVVFTNGCFDLLHAGHILSLQRSRALGDHLIVGLNADASVRRLKGPERPLQKETDRAEVLAALACVDAVIVYEDDTPLALINAIKPDVLAKGGDYVIETIVGAKEVLSWGGRVEVIPLLEGRSTTDLVIKVRTQKG